MDIITVKSFPLLTIDPSINSLGYAIFESVDNEHTSQRSRTVKLTEHGTIKAVAEKSSRLAFRIHSMCNQLADKIEEKGFLFIDTAVIELPQTFGSFKSIASEHGGDIQKLNLMVGGLILACAQQGMRVELCPVTQWKGQLKKEHTRASVNKFFSLALTQHDEIDAIGIGKYILDTEVDHGGGIVNEGFWTLPRA